MNVDVLVPMLLPLAAWPVARFVAPRLPPRWASWLLAATCLTLAAASTAALAVQALAGLTLVPAVAAFGDFSPDVLRGFDPVSVPVSIICGVVLVVLCVAVARAALRERRRSRRLHAALDDHSTGGGVIVLPGDDPLAFALPGRGGRIVVSVGMLAALEPAERSALLLHECAHLRLRHCVFATVVALSCVLNPLIRPLGEVARFALERWADEAAASRVGDRRIVATAVAKAALAGRSGRSFALAATGGPVPQRVAALLADQSRRRVVAPLALLGVGLVFGITGWSSGVALDAVSDLHAGIETAQASMCASHGQPVFGQRAHGESEAVAVRHHHGDCAER